MHLSQPVTQSCRCAKSQEATMNTNCTMKSRSEQANVRRILPWRSRRRGNGVMEAALVLPVLLYLSMGMVEFGQYFYAKHTIQAAARDGARNAILPTATQTTATTAISNTMSSANFSSSTYSYTFTDALYGTAISNVALVSKGSGI